MSKYLALSDLDDTLLTGEKKITEESKEFLREFVKRGNIFAICTGRPYNGALSFQDELGFNMPMVCDNGCAIFNLDGKSKFFEIPLDVFKSFLKDSKDMDAYMYVTTGTKTVYADQLSHVPTWIIHNEYNDLNIIEGDLDEVVDIPPLICNFWLKDEYYQEFLEILKKYDKYIFNRYWGKYYQDDLGIYCHSFEIHSNTAGKGNALKYLKEYYHIDDDKTMAFGDQLNDISMIEEAFYGVAMINAVGELKSATKYETDYDFNNNGVIEFIKKNKLY